MFGNLFIDERINDVKQVEKIFVNQSINIYFEYFKINN